MWIMWIVLIIIISGTIAAIAIDENKAKAAKAKEDHEQFYKNLKNKEFTISKKYVFSNIIMYIDNKNKSWCVKKGNSTKARVYAFGNIIGYNVKENGKKIIEGKVGAALIGSAFLGGTGAVIGASGARNVNQACSDLRLQIITNISSRPMIELQLIQHEVSTDSPIYTYATSFLDKLVAQLRQIIDYNNKSNQYNNYKPEVDFESKIQALDRLYKKGLITNEEFEKTKREILSKI